MTRTALAACGLLVPVLCLATPPDTAVTEGIERAKKRLSGLLKEEATRLKKPIRTDHRPGPMGWLVARAAIVDAYPGTGVATALVGPDGTSYGRRGTRTMTSLAKKLGWLTRAPAGKLALKVLNQAYYDGMLAWDSAVAPTATLVAGTLTIRFVRMEPLSQARSNVVMTLAQGTPARVTEKPHK